MSVRDQHLDRSPAKVWSTVTAGYHYPDLECLVIFFYNPGLKNCRRGWGLDLSQVPVTFGQVCCLGGD